VYVDWRPLYGLSKLTPGHHPLGHWHHTYIEIDPPSPAIPETWGVLGENNSSKNQQVLYDDPRNNNVGGGETEIPCSDSEAQTLEGALNSTDYASAQVCPSCGANYHNGPFPLIDVVSALSFFNSNTYTYNMINNWGKTPPAVPNAPGYHYDSRYAGYF